MLYLQEALLERLEAGTVCKLAHAFEAAGTFL